MTTKTTSCKVRQRHSVLFCRGPTSRDATLTGLQYEGQRQLLRYAFAESFYYTLMVEAIHDERFATREEMRHTVFEYIEVDYNRTHRHSANGRISPMAFEEIKTAAQDVHSIWAGSLACTGILLPQLKLVLF